MLALLLLFCDRIRRGHILSQYVYEGHEQFLTANGSFNQLQFITKCITVVKSVYAEVDGSLLHG